MILNIISQSFQLCAIAQLHCIAAIGRSVEARGVADHCHMWSSENYNRICGYSQN